MADIYRERPHHAPEGAASALRRLQEHGIGLGIVSNRGARPGRFVMRYLEANGLAGFFDPAAVIWSDEVGFEQPDPHLPHLPACARGSTRAGGPRRRPQGQGCRRRTSAGDDNDPLPGVRDDHDDGPEADTVILHYRELPPALGFSAYGDGPLPSTPTARAAGTSLAAVVWDGHFARTPPRPAGVSVQNSARVLEKLVERPWSDAAIEARVGLGRDLGVARFLGTTRSPRLLTEVPVNLYRKGNRGRSAWVSGGTQPECEAVVLLVLPSRA